MAHRLLGPTKGIVVTEFYLKLSWKSLIKLRFRATISVHIAYIEII